MGSCNNLPHHEMCPIYFFKNHSTLLCSVLKIHATRLTVFIIRLPVLYSEYQLSVSFSLSLFLSFFLSLWLFLDVSFPLFIAVSLSLPPLFLNVSLYLPPPLYSCLSFSPSPSFYMSLFLSLPLFIAVSLSLPPPLYICPSFSLCLSFSNFSAFPLQLVYP